MKGLNKAQELKKSFLLQLYARGQAPCRDYYGLTIAERCICLNIWVVTHGPFTFPKQKFSPVEDFPHDKYLQEEIRNVFGQNVSDYITNLANNKRKLENMPPKILSNIFQYLNINDIIRLSRVSKIYHELCESDTVWQLMFKKMLNRCPSSEEKRLAFDMGWKGVLQKRLEFIKKAFAERKNKTNTKTTNVKSVNVKPLVYRKSVTFKK